METKTIAQYAIGIALLLLVVLGLINLFTTSDKLKESKRLIENVLNETKASKAILEKQAKTIVELQQLNRELAGKVNQVDSINTLIKSNMEASFARANKNMNAIRTTLDNIQAPVIH